MQQIDINRNPRNIFQAVACSWYITPTKTENNTPLRFTQTNWEGIPFTKRSNFFEFTQEIYSPNKGRKTNKRMGQRPLAKGKGGTKLTEQLDLLTSHLAAVHTQTLVTNWGPLVIQEHPKGPTLLNLLT